MARIHNGAVYPAHFYVRGDELAVIYIGDRDFLTAVLGAALEAPLEALGCPLRAIDVDGDACAARAMPSALQPARHQIQGVVARQ